MVTHCFWKKCFAKVSRVDKAFASCEHCLSKYFLLLDTNVFTWMSSGMRMESNKTKGTILGWLYWCLYSLFPVLRDDFRQMPRDTQVAQGEKAVLNCSPPRGNPPPQVKWLKNGQYIQDLEDSTDLASLSSGGSIGGGSQVCPISQLYSVHFSQSRISVI